MWCIFRWQDNNELADEGELGRPWARRLGFCTLLSSCVVGFCVGVNQCEAIDTQATGTCQCFGYRVTGRSKLDARGEAETSAILIE